MVLLSFILLLFPQLSFGNGDRPYAIQEPRVPNSTIIEGSTPPSDPGPTRAPAASPDPNLFLTPEALQGAKSVQRSLSAFGSVNRLADSFKKGSAADILKHTLRTGAICGKMAGLDPMYADTLLAVSYAIECGQNFGTVQSSLSGLWALEALGDATGYPITKAATIATAGPILNMELPKGGWFLRGKTLLGRAGLSYSLLNATFPLPDYPALKVFGLVPALSSVLNLPDEARKAYNLFQESASNILILKRDPNIPFEISKNEFKKPSLVDIVCRFNYNGKEHVISPHQGTQVEGRWVRLEEKDQPTSDLFALKNDNLRSIRRACKKQLKSILDIEDSELLNFQISVKGKLSFYPVAIPAKSKGTETVTFKTIQ